MFPLLYISLLLPIQATFPGIQLSIREAWIASLYPVLLSELRTLALHDFGNFTFEHALDVGTIYLNVTNLTVTDVELDVANSFVKVSSPNFVNITAVGVGASFTCGYSAKYELVSYVGNAQVSLTDAMISLNVTLAAANNKPQIQINGLVINSGTLSLVSNLSTLVNDLVVREANSELHSLASSAMSLLSNFLPTTNRLLSLLPIQYSVSSGLEVDVGLVEAFTVEADKVVAMGINGTVFQKTQKQAITPEPLVNLPLDYEYPEGIGIAVSDYTISSAIASYFAQLDLFIVKLPDSLHMSLSTDTVAVLFPELKAAYGSNVPIALRVTAGENLPQYFTNGLINLILDLNVEFLALQGGQWVSGLTLGFEAEIGLNATLEDSYARGELQTLNLTNFSIVNSSVGNVNLYLLNLLMQDVLELYLPALNSLLSYTLEVPASLPFKLGANDLGVYSGYLLLAVDLAFPSNR